MVQLSGKSGQLLTQNMHVLNLCNLNTVHPRVQAATRRAMIAQAEAQRRPGEPAPNSLKALQGRATPIR
jgi:hypothetical protein